MSPDFRRSVSGRPGGGRELGEPVNRGGSESGKYRKPRRISRAFSLINVSNELVGEVTARHSYLQSYPGMGHTTGTRIAWDSSQELGYH